MIFYVIIHIVYEQTHLGREDRGMSSQKEGLKNKSKRTLISKNNSKRTSLRVELVKISKKLACSKTTNDENEL